MLRSFELLQNLFVDFTSITHKSSNYSRSLSEKQLIFIWKPKIHLSSILRGTKLTKQPNDYYRLLFQSISSTGKLIYSLPWASYSFFFFQSPEGARKCTRLASSVTRTRELLIVVWAHLTLASSSSSLQPHPSLPLFLALILSLYSLTVPRSHHPHHQGSAARSATSSSSSSRHISWRSTGAAPRAAEQSKCSAALRL